MGRSALGPDRHAGAPDFFGLAAPALAETQAEWAYTIDGEDTFAQ